MRQDLTLEEAQALVKSDSFEPYGGTRLYGVIADGPSAGQIAAIKSSYHLEQYSYSELYTVTRDGVPIRKA